MLNTLVHDKPVSVGSQWALYNPTLVVARIYKGAPCTYYSQRLPFEQADCSPSGLGFYVMIFITTLGSLHKRTIHIGVNQIGLAVT